MSLILPSHNIYTGETDIISPPDTQNFLFDGIAEYMTFDNSTLFSFTDGVVDSAFSIVYRFKLNEINKLQWLICKREANTVAPYNNEWQISITAANQLVFVLWDSTSSPNDLIGIRTNYVLTTNKIYTAVASYDGLGNASGMSIALDGVNLSTTNISSGVYNKMVPSSASVVIAKNNWLPSAYFLDGNVSYIAAYNKEITADEVLALHNRAEPLTISNCIFYNNYGDRSIFDGTDWVSPNLANLDTEDTYSVLMERTDIEIN